jgi:hypothetical protein
LRLRQILAEKGLHDLLQGVGGQEAIVVGAHGTEVAAVLLQLVLIEDIAVFLVEVDPTFNLSLWSKVLRWAGNGSLKVGLACTGDRLVSNVLVDSARIPVLQVKCVNQK